MKYRRDPLLLAGIVILILIAFAPFWPELLSLIG